MLQVTIHDTQKTLFEALQACSAGWHDRSAIAGKLGKKWLNPAEVVALDLLAEAGWIEMALQPTRRKHIMRTIYRIKE